MLAGFSRAEIPVTLPFLFLTLRVIDELYLPKFSIFKNYRLENILPELGIREVFSTQADLSGITGAKDISVSQVRHDTWCH
jgi:serpin peptidase inhibitor clade A protein 3